jgi:hypothetical protein
MVDEKITVFRDLTSRNLFATLIHFLISNPPQCTNWFLPCHALWHRKTTLSSAAVSLISFLSFPVFLPLPLPLGKPFEGQYSLLFPLNYVGSLRAPIVTLPIPTTNKQTNKQTPWSESASELYQPSDRRFSAKWLPTFAEKGCHVVSVTDPSGRILGFLDRSRYFCIK